MLVFHAANALCIGYIALYRGELYRFSTSAWALSAAAVAFGALAPLGLPRAMRVRLLAGSWPLVLVLPFVALFLGPGLVPSPITVGPFFFCAAASFGTCILVTSNVSRRRKRLKRLLADGGAFDDPLVRPQLEIYFAAGAPFAEEDLTRLKPLHRSLRAQAWFPSKARRTHAAALLRDYAVFLGRTLEAGRGIRPPSEVLEPYASADPVSSEQMRSAFLSAASQLENGGRLFTWRSWLLSVSPGGLDASRDWFYAISVLAGRHGVGCPEWFRRVRRILGRAALTPMDVASPWTAVRSANPS